ncbi:hypothetical protein [Vulcanisaeta sp. JCM 14467]|nr:hypothetical protein [Vulcanisaeta sp. JCM 14467]
MRCHIINEGIGDLSVIWIGKGVALGFGYVVAEVVGERPIPHH